MPSVWSPDGHGVCIIGRCSGGEPQHHRDAEVHGEVHGEVHAEMAAVRAAVLLSSSTLVPLVYWLARMGSDHLVLSTPL